MASGQKQAKNSEKNNPSAEPSDEDLNTKHDLNAVQVSSPHLKNPTWNYLFSDYFELELETHLQSALNGDLDDQRHANK